MHCKKMPLLVRLLPLCKTQSNPGLDAIEFSKSATLHILHSEHQSHNTSQVVARAQFEVVPHRGVFSLMKLGIKEPPTHPG